MGSSLRSRRSGLRAHLRRRAYGAGPGTDRFVSRRVPALLRAAPWTAPRSPTSRGRLRPVHSRTCASAWSKPVVAARLPCIRAKSAAHGTSRRSGHRAAWRGGGRTAVGCGERGESISPESQARSQEVKQMGTGQVALSPIRAADPGCAARLGLPCPFGAGSDVSGRREDPTYRARTRRFR